MTSRKFSIALGAFGLAITLTAQAPAIAGSTKPHATVQKKIAPSGGRSRAQPGDTCLGVSACNTLIAECVGSGHDFKPIEHKGPNGEPSYGQCVKRTD